MNRQLRFPFPKRSPSEEDQRIYIPELENAPVSRDQLRSRRHREVRAKSISTKRLPRHELELGRVLYPSEEHADVERPKTRADCSGVPRPCPFVACAHHLYLDVSKRNGTIKLNFPDLEPDELPPAASCALDVADTHGETLETVGRCMNLTRERVRQVEVKAFAKLAATRDLQGLRDVSDARPGQRDTTKRRYLPVLLEDGVAATYGE